MDAQHVADELLEARLYGGHGQLLGHVYAFGVLCHHLREYEGRGEFEYHAVQLQ